MVSYWIDDKNSTILQIHRDIMINLVAPTRLAPVTHTTQYVNDLLLDVIKPGLTDKHALQMTCESVPFRTADGPVLARHT